MTDAPLIVTKGDYTGPFLVALFRGLVSDGDLDALVAPTELERDRRAARPLSPLAARRRLLRMQIAEAKRHRNPSLVQQLNIELAALRVQPVGRGFDRISVDAFVDPYAYPPPPPTRQPKQKPRARCCANCSGAMIHGRCRDCCWPWEDRGA
jgi:hypothetical protein